MFPCKSEKFTQKLNLKVCICDESLCNTFAFLRSQIDGNYEEQQQQRLIASDYVKDPFLIF